MNSMINWLQTILSRWGAVADKPSEVESVVPDTSESAGDADISTQNQDSEKNAAMPDIYADKDTAPAPDRKFLDPSSPSADKTTGFNPYDTAKMHKK